jgi:hypothetical protein
MVVTALQALLAYAVAQKDTAGEEAEVQIFEQTKRSRLALNSFTVRVNNSNAYLPTDCCGGRTDGAAIKRPCA